jgi:hypothetical protein
VAEEVVVVEVVVVEVSTSPKALYRTIRERS